MTAPVPFDTNNRPPGGLPMAAAFQNIASAAFSRGAVIAAPSGSLKDLPAADLMRALRGAWKNVQGNAERTSRVEAIARAIASKLGQGGPVQVSPSSFGVLNSFAGIVATQGTARPIAHKSHHPREQKRSKRGKQ